ncbi:MAG TPA: urea ABC transporter permease subunit UrtB, partial [Devosia sp.]|nr:urea ABC transporter permease subunit UrtB [Devosia sp.]
MTLHIVRLIAVLLALVLSPLPTSAQPADFATLVAALGQGGFPEREAAMDALVATGDARVPPILQALSDGTLYLRKADQRVLFAAKSGSTFALTDPLDGGDAGTASSREIEKIKVNNGLRGKIRTAIGMLTLLSPDRSARMSAAQSILKNADPAMLPQIDSALAAETDSGIKSTMELARAVIVLKSDAGLDDQRAAVDIIAAHGDQAAQTVLLNALASAPDALKPTIQSGIDAIGRTLQIWQVAQNLLYGISLSSVLLLAAIGLSITFGVMGIINMAHGEMVMLGAYTTFVVQNLIRNFAPGLLDYSLAFAVPAAFLFTALIGIA